MLTRLHHRLRHWRRTTLVLLPLLAAVLLIGSLEADWDFGQITKLAEKRYGPLGSARFRLNDWQELLRTEADAPLGDKLQAVNLFFNRNLRFRNDRDLWQAKDYWATPVESLHKGSGDCEDYAIAKYFTLRKLGVPSDKLRITYVKAVRLKQAHMVLTYYPTPNAIPLVLDNLIDGIVSADKRNDLVPVYAFNAEGMWLPGAGGNKRVGDSKRLSRWVDLTRKMQAEGFPAESAK